MVHFFPIRRIELVYSYIYERLKGVINYRDFHSISYTYCYVTKAKAGLARSALCGGAVVGFSGNCGKKPFRDSLKDISPP